MSDTARDKRRLFFALWPDASSRGRILAAADTASLARAGRPVPAGNLHVTLCFLGAVSAALLPRIEGIAREAALSCAPVRLVLTRLAWWQRSQVVCAVAGTGVRQSGARLARLLHAGVNAAGVVTDARSWRPHVTLVRHARAARALRRGFGPIELSFPDFALIESRSSPQGASYSIVRSYPLYGAAGAAPDPGAAAPTS